MRWRAVQLVGVELVYLLRLLVLARILLPEAFGLIAIAVTSVGILMSVSEVGMVQALVQAPHATREQYDGAWTVGLLRAAVVTVALIAAAPVIAHLFDVADATPIIQALAFRPLIDAAASIGVARLTKELHFRRLAMMQLPAAVVDLLVAVTLAGSLGVWAIVAGTLSGALTSTLASYAVARHVPRLSFRFADLLPLIRYGRWILITGIVALAGTTLTQLIISRSLGAAALGVYFLALKVAFLPSTAASAVVGAVAFPIFAQLRGEPERTSAAFRQLLAGLLLVLIPVYAMVFVLAPSLEMALGAKWAATSPIIRIIAVSCVIGVFGELLVQLMLGQGRSDAAFRLELVQTGTLVVVAWPLISAFGVAGAALAWLVGNLAAAIGGLHWLRRRVQLREAVDFGLTACAAAAAAGAGFAAAGIWQAWPGMAGLFAAGICGAAAAVAIVLLLAHLFKLRLDAVIAWMRARAERGPA